MSDDQVTQEVINTLRPRENGCHFGDDIFKCIFVNENLRIPIKISQKFVPKGPINNISGLVQKMTWHWPGDKPLSETIMVRLPTHICVTRPQWVKTLVSNAEHAIGHISKIFINRFSSHFPRSSPCTIRVIYSFLQNMHTWVEEKCYHSMNKLSINNQQAQNQILSI